MSTVYNFLKYKNVDDITRFFKNIMKTINKIFVGILKSGNIYYLYCIHINVW